MSDATPAKNSDSAKRTKQRLFQQGLQQEVEDLKAANVALREAASLELLAPLLLRFDTIEDLLRQVLGHVTLPVIVPVSSPPFVKDPHGPAYGTPSTTAPLSEARDEALEFEVISDTDDGTVQRVLFEEPSDVAKNNPVQEK